MRFRKERLLTAIVLFAVLAGCQLSVGAGTPIGDAVGVSTRVTVDTETGQVDPSVSAGVVIR